MNVSRPSYDSCIRTFGYYLAEAEAWRSSVVGTAAVGIRRTLSPCMPVADTQRTGFRMEHIQAAVASEGVE